MSFKSVAKKGKSIEELGRTRQTDQWKQLLIAGFESVAKKGKPIEELGRNRNRKSGEKYVLARVCDKENMSQSTREWRKKREGGKE